MIHLLVLREEMPVLPLVEGTQLCEYIDDGVRKLRFEIIKNVGAGTFGITYTAKDASFNYTLCVIKEFALAQLCNRDTRSGSIVPFKTNDPRKDEHREKMLKTWQDRFILEANNLNKIHHSNVVSVRLAWRERGTVFYAMNYVEGKELSSPDRKDWKPQKWSEIKPLAFKLLDALEAVHEVELIHGDVKPSNVLLTKKNEPILIDFGTARNLADFQNTLQKGTHAYTPGYAPPELHGVNNTKRVSPSSDLYSWGMMIIGLLASHPETHDGSPMDAMFRYQSLDGDPYSDLASWLTNVPLNVIEVLQKCVQLDYRNRPKNIAETRKLFTSEIINSGNSDSKQIEKLQKALREEKERTIQAQKELAKRKFQERKLQERKLQEEKQKPIQTQNTFRKEKSRNIPKQVAKKTADILVESPKDFLVVGGINGYTTINKALRIASSGTTIRILPGTYRESLVINKNITILGVGKVEEIIIIGSGKSVISSTAKQARIQNVTLKEEYGNYPCVDISGGKIQIEECEISGGNNCIAIYGQSVATIRNNLIHKAKQKKDDYKTGHGIYLYENAKGTIERNEIFNNENGISINFTATSVVRKNQIYKNKLSGVGIFGKGTFEENDIFKNYFGISVGLNGVPMVRNNQIYENKKSGIKIDGKGTFEENNIFKNKASGIFVDSDGNSVVFKNRIHENKKSGIKINGKGTFEQNDIFKNETFGISVTSNGDPIVYNNWIHENKESGIEIFGKGTFEENDIFKNNFGIYVDSNADPMVRKNRIHENKASGIGIFGKGTFEKNDIFKNNFGIYVDSKADPMVRKNWIHENKESGIKIEGKGRFEKNDIFKNEKAGIFVNLKADPVVRKNRIHENKLNGIQIDGEGTFEENDILKNKLSGIFVNLKADPAVRNNRIYENKFSGIQIDDKGVFEANNIFKNESSGIHVNSKADPVVRNNRIHQYLYHFNESVVCLKSNFR